MNYFTLTFLDPTYEQQFKLAQFEIEKSVFRKIVWTMFLVCVTSTIINLILTNYTNGFIMFAITLIMYVVSGTCQNNMRYFDILILLVQLAAHSLYPISIFIGAKSGFDEESQDPFICYEYGLIIAQFSFASLFGSKYYLKAIPFVYSMCLQIIMATIRGYAFVPFKAFYMISVIAILFHLYFDELARRREYIKAQRQDLQNQNMLSNFRSPYFMCYLDKFSLKLLSANVKAKFKLNIKDQQYFLETLRETTIEGLNNSAITIDLEKCIYAVIRNNSILNQFTTIQTVMQVVGTFNKQKYRYHISKYVDEEKLVIVQVSVQKVRDKTPLPLLEMHKLIMTRLHKAVVQFVEPIIIHPSKSAETNYRAHRLFIDFYNSFLYGNLKIIEPIIRVNLRTLIIDLYSLMGKQLRDKKIQLVFKYRVNAHEVKQKFKLLYLLMSNLVSHSIHNCVSYGQINFNIESQSDNLIQCRIQYSNSAIKPLQVDFELQIIGYIVGQLGPMCYVFWERHSTTNVLRFQLYQEQIKEQLPIHRKPSEAKYIKMSDNS